MHNNTPYGYSPYQNYHSTWEIPQVPLPNRLIYVNQQPQVFSQPRSQTVLVNPHFKANNKVFVNPNFNHQRSTIHVNPRLKNEIISQMKPKSTKIHINPNVKCVHLNPQKLIGRSEKKENIPLVLTKTKLIRAPQMANMENKKKRRNSVKSKYKIVKSGLSPKNKFKVDNRKRKLSISKTSLLNLSNLAKFRIIKSNLNNVNINGRIYKKTRNSLRRASLSTLKQPAIKRKLILKSQYKLINKSNIVPNKRNILQSQYKLINCKSVSSVKIINKKNVKETKKFKIARKQSPKKKKDLKISSKKLKKCNIPCPTFRKHGICKGKDNGKCFLKHDPDQVALCTRFLQGACLKENCLLSHNVSPEKMPTCKYYLEGTCSKENCPYLHVKISAKADVCRDFLEGFCKKAAECEKRHQYLCPDYEKYGKCVKQRCPYPHGKMVRTYLINKNKFAKKCSENIDLALIKSDDNKSEQNPRYYAENNGKTDTLNEKEVKVADGNNLKNFVGLQSRVKLGSLPGFIPFGES